MKKSILMFFSGILYILFLLYYAGFHISQLADIKSLLLVAGGSFILSLPHLEKNQTCRDFLHVFAGNSLMAGYISTFILIMGDMYNAKDISALLSEIALNCRSILYGFLLYLLFKATDDSKETIEARKPSAEEENETLCSLGLTRREIEVTRLVKKDYTNAEIAEELFITENTVKKHITNIFHKLEIKNREALKRYKL